MRITEARTPFFRGCTIATRGKKERVAVGNGLAPYPRLAPGSRLQAAEAAPGMAFFGPFNALRTLARQTAAAYEADRRPPAEWSRRRTIRATLFITGAPVFIASATAPLSVGYTHTV